jgi:hypothetical protein
MASMTWAKCLQKCKKFGSCCSSEQCDMVAEYAAKRGVTLADTGNTLRFLKDGKCIVPPHLRPLCSLQQCDIQSMGFSAGDPDWTEAYFELHEQLGELELNQILSRART